MCAKTYYMTILTLIVANMSFVVKSLNIMDANINGDPTAYIIEGLAPLCSLYIYQGSLISDGW